MKTIALQEKFNLFTEQWSPKIIAELNGQQVKIAKIEGEFVWHKHDNEDELFMVIEGEMEMHYRDSVEVVKPGEIIVVPRGLEHKPVTKSETKILLFEPASTLNTGNVNNERTKTDLSKI